MSLEAALEANTAAIKELTAALLSIGALQTAQASAALHSAPGVQAVAAAQKQLADKEAGTAKKPSEATQSTAAATSAPSGEQSAPTPGKFSAAPELQPWAEVCAETYVSLKDGEASLDNIKTAILAINSKIDRAQANAVLGRFGAQAVTAKADKRGLDPEQYQDFFALCLDVLSGRVDATASITTEA
ncbi:hypothetical protein A3203_32720 [Burkholderia cenocepacia]|uniref:hypothetical protein n=1 Tax=Burkholderia cenocepacia TaxID=95486 RepID=UPI00078CA9B4|nr:hypothetical protein [Burkholderia cenocepacia]AMU17541.1 hypothetical protein A3203_32720 [Burkholderia cenocepacia]